MNPCDELPGRLGQICRGEADVPQRMRRKYIDLWLADGMLADDPDASGPVPSGEDQPPQLQRVRPPKVDRSQPCVHRGDHVSTIVLSCCGGKKKDLPILACALHEECIEGQGREGVRGCRGCGDYEARITESEGTLPS